MPRFVTVHLKCDWQSCTTVGEEGDGQVVEKTLALDSRQAKSFLLCKAHLEAFEETVLPLMERGVKAEAPVRAKKAAPPPTGKSPEAISNGTDIWHCRVEGCGRDLRKRMGMAQHVIKTHGFESLDAYEKRYDQEDA